MIKRATLPVLLLAAATVLSGCLVPDHPGPNNLIARGHDGGIGGRHTLRDGDAAIAYDPDGCQGWIIDDGVEGYSGRRFDPVSGLPICNNRFPPGTVLAGRHTSNSPISDWVPTN